MALQSLNPATGENVAHYDEHDGGTVDEMIDRAVNAFDLHRERSFSDRADKMLHAADLLERRSEEFGRVMTQEMGKPIDQAVAEARKCALVCRYYARHAKEFLRDEPAGIDDVRAFVAFEPLGPILAVMPWNFPFWQVFRFASPALMAGNVALLKHASNVSGCALAIENVLREAGFNQDEFQTLLVSSDRVDGLIADPRIRAATLTGSVGAGRAVAASAGKAIKPSVMELGGSDPFIVLSDANMERAVEIGVTARMQNNGQSCIAAKRFIIEDSAFDEFVPQFVNRIEALRVGDPMDPDTDVGPVASSGALEVIHDQVQRAVADDARIRTGGTVLDRPGFFYAPTVLDGVEPGTVAFEEEIFGPVASVISARDVDHAVTLANDTRFGLGGAVFTEDREKGERVARQLEVGCAFVNEMVKSDPRLPFGGVKESGYGRELSRFGIREFVNVKTIWIA
ncbi:MAG: NAD-dependent succinate-semialdehyde dehydrogenase [Rhodothermales bacterium]